jgi:hypothetical protein
MKKNIEILTKEILEEYTAGSSLEKIKDKYGDFGIDYINKYKKQNVTGNLIDLFSSKNNEELKKEIYNLYLSGTSKKEIKNKYGDFGILIISKILEKLTIPRI